MQKKKRKNGNEKFYKITTWKYTCNSYDGRNRTNDVNERASKERLSKLFWKQNKWKSYWKFRLYSSRVNNSCNIIFYFNFFLQIYKIGQRVCSVYFLFIIFLFFFKKTAHFLEIDYTNDIFICKLFTDCNNLALTLSRGRTFPEFALLSSKFRSTWPIPVIFFDDEIFDETSA